MLNLPLSLTERAPIAAQLSRFRQFEVGRDLFAGNLASAIFDLPFTLLFIVLLFVIGGSLAFVPIGLALVMIIVCAVAATVSTGQLKRLSASKLRSDASLFELTDKLKTIRNASAERMCLARYADSVATYQRARFDSVQHGSRVRIDHQRPGRPGWHHDPQPRCPARHGRRHVGWRADRCHDDRLARAHADPDRFAQYRTPRQTLATVGQINDVVRIGTDRERDAPPNLSRRLSGNILASGLYLSFGPQAEPQLRRVDLEVKAGEIVAITGPSGGGKSTLLKALLGLYPQYMGTIRLGGLDLRQLNPAEIRAAVGYVSQQPAFFDDSLAANFRYAHPSASDADILEALAAVGLSLPHPALPQGLATRIASTRARLPFARLAVPPLDRACPGQEARHPASRRPGRRPRSARRRRIHGPPRYAARQDHGPAGYRAAKSLAACRSRRPHALRHACRGQRRDGHSERPEADYEQDGLKP